ncbi:hypothetical protein [uncultured Psychrobacter sp.]|uniref:hypothetical protein n=1 Tax=uncultured Psychrobacter sp. TaxID=259303 RepID=UPI003459087F
MAFNFDKLLQQGKGAAENVVKNQKEIKEVLEDLENSLGQFLEIPIKLEEYIGYVKNEEDPFVYIAKMLKPREKTGYDEVHISSEQVNLTKEIFQLKYSDDIYPVTIVRDRNHSVADNQSEFAAAIGQIVSNPQFHLQLNSFKRQVEEKLQESL